MKIFGIDFTSAPSRQKPITVARGRLHDRTLEIQSINPLDTLAAFGGFLSTDGSWVAGIDFPFGQPCKFVRNIGWPLDWRQYVRVVGDMPREQFISVIRSYQQGRPKGDIRHFREVDRLAHSCSPMQLDFVPVARMFHEGAPRLLHAACSVYPFYSVDHDERVAVEAYPALVARKCIGDRTYKTDNKKKQTDEHREARRQIVGALNATTNDADSVIRNAYGLGVKIPEELAQDAIEDSTGDVLDAVLCAIQAAWAHSRRASGFGMKPGCDLTEGWIADPKLLPHAQVSERSDSMATDHDVRDRAAEFVRLLNELSAHLRSLQAADINQSFFQLIEAAARRSAAVRRFRDELKDFGDLRNSIVHHRAFPDEVIAGPTAKTLTRLRSIVEQIISPPKLIPTFQKDIRVFQLTEPLVSALKYMKEKDFSQVVLKTDGGLALLTAEGIANWLEQRADEDIISLRDPTIADPFAFEAAGGFLIMSRNQPTHEATV